MSAGPFTLSKYQADSGSILPIRIQPETAAAAIGATTNGAPAGAVTAGAALARVSGGRRRYGLKARSVAIRFTAAPPTGYATGGVQRIPALTPAFYNAATVGAVCTYLGTAGIVVGKSSEAGR